MGSTSFKPTTPKSLPPTRSQPSDSFVEALKHTHTPPNPPSADLFQDHYQKLEEERQFAKRRRQEFLVFSQKEETRRKEIITLQEELQKLVEEIQDVSQEVDTAVSQQLVNPGIYHANFFDKLRQLIKLLRQRVHDSRTWLATFNQRAQAKLGYWGQVQTSGTKFMLSQERYMVTQTG